MKRDTVNIGIILLLSGLGLLFLLWIGVIVPNANSRHQLGILSFLTIIRIEDILDNPTWTWIDDLEDTYNLLKIFVILLAFESMPLEILSIDINVFFYIALFAIIIGFLITYSGSH